MPHFVIRVIRWLGLPDLLQRRGIPFPYAWQFDGPIPTDDVLEIRSDPVLVKRQRLGKEQRPEICVVIPVSRVLRGRGILLVDCETSRVLARLHTRWIAVARHPRMRRIAVVADDGGVTCSDPCKNALPIQAARARNDMTLI